jgi:hypothetical protein
MSVALLMDQRRVEDWPASTVEGSALKLLITGAGGGGWVTAAGGGGGGGGGGGTFFAQPTANNTSAKISTNLPDLNGCPELDCCPHFDCPDRDCDACNLELSLILGISSS